MWALWVVVGLVGWFVLAGLVAVVIGRGIRLADRRELSTADRYRLEAGESPNFVAPSPTTRTVVSARAGRRRVPLPPVGVALAGLGVLLEFTGFLLRLSGAEGETARVLSMDAPLSVPRMYIAVLFAVSAVSALSGASRIPGRRPWWTAVGVVAAAICFVKAGGTVHAAAFSRLSAAIGSIGADVVSALLAVAVIGSLWFLARGDRRDRLRVLGALALYAVASVGLSAVSDAVSGARAAITATFVEESGEALGAVVFLVAVLVGVAPRLVLPAEWALRRTADAHTLDAAADPSAAGRRTAPGRRGPSSADREDQYQCLRPPISRPAKPRMARMAPMTSRMIPMVQRMGMLATKPITSRMMPRMIMRSPSDVGGRDH